MNRCERLLGYCVLGLGLVSCAPARAAQAPTRPAILTASQGEHRLLFGRRPLVFKVDPVTVGSRRLLLGTVLMLPGDSIPVHRHLQEQEALYILRGTLEARVGDLHGTAGAGGTIFIPESTWVGVRNPGPDTAAALRRACHQEGLPR